jgi:glycosyltransferase involved in cell wall biosynthesis
MYKPNASKTIFINGRFLTQPITGIQRYAREIVSRLVLLEPDRFRILVPRGNHLNVPESLRSRVQQLGRFQGHLWEQLELGPYANWQGGLLYSPTMSNPVVVSNQIFTVQDLFVLEYPEWVGLNFHRWYSWLLPKLIRRSKPVVAGSLYARSEIVRRFSLPASAIQVISCGVDSRFFPADELERLRVKAKFQLPDQFFLSLGSLEPRKNLRNLIDAWLGLPEHDRWPLLIAGKLGASQVFGDFDLSTLVRTGHDIRILGYVPDDDLSGLYSSASVFVYVSLLEGFGLPPLEAAVCGAKVLTSNNSGMLEVMSGFATMVDPLSVHNITSGLMASMLAPLPTAEQCVLLRQRYDWDVSAQKLLDLLNQESSLG